MTDYILDTAKTIPTIYAVKNTNDSVTVYISHPTDGDYSVTKIYQKTAGGGFDTYVDESGSGNITTSVLTTSGEYRWIGLAFYTDNKVSLPSNIAIATISPNNKRIDSNSINAVRSLIKQQCSYEVVTWYKRNTSTTIPSPYVNSGQTGISASASYEQNMKVSVTDRPTFWSNQGSIYMYIQRGTLHGLWMQNMRIKVKVYRGFVPSEYNVDDGDHIIDQDNYEYLVINASQSYTKGFTRVDLLRI